MRQPLNLVTLVILAALCGSLLAEPAPSISTHGSNKGGFAHNELSNSKGRDNLEVVIRLMNGQTVGRAERNGRPHVYDAAEVEKESQHLLQELTQGTDFDGLPSSMVAAILEEEMTKEQEQTQTGGKARFASGASGSTSASDASQASLFPSKGSFASASASASAPSAQLSQLDVEPVIQATKILVTMAYDYVENVVAEWSGAVTGLDRSQIVYAFRNVLAHAWQLILSVLPDWMLDAAIFAVSLALQFLK